MHRREGSKALWSFLSADRVARPNGLCYLLNVPITLRSFRHRTTEAETAEPRDHEALEFVHPAHALAVAQILSPNQSDRAVAAQSFDSWFDLELVFDRGQRSLSRRFRRR